jgi:GNAT superfamily N-acetyltransferase
MIRIEVASPADISALARVEIESKLQSFPEHMDEIAIDPEIRTYRWHTYFDGETPVSAKAPRIVFKAIKDRQIVGFIAGHLTNRYEKDAEIQSFYVLRNEQRSGIGSALLKSLLTWLKKQNAKSLCVGIFPENPYLVFYLKYGGLHLNPYWIYWDDLSFVQEKLEMSK